MNKVLIIVIIAVLGIAAFTIPTLLQAGYYGFVGTPQVALLYPDCNGTTTTPVIFIWQGEPNPYDHYMLQLREGSVWDGAFLMQIASRGTNYTTVLEPGMYIFNVIAFNANNETSAGSSPCVFYVQ